MSSKNIRNWINVSYTLRHFISMLVNKQTKVVDQHIGLLEFKNYCHVNSKDGIVVLVNTKEVIAAILPTICHISKSLPKDRNSYAWKFHMLRPYFNEIYDDTRIHVPTYHRKIMSLIKNKVIPPKGSLDLFQRLCFTLGWVQVHWTRASLWLGYIFVGIRIDPLWNLGLPLSKCSFQLGLWGDFLQLRSSSRHFNHKLLTAYL